MTITITPENDAPIAIGDSRTSDEDRVDTIPSSDLLANDIDVDLPDDELTISMVSGSSLMGATVTLSDDGLTVTYDPRNASAIQALRPGDVATDLFTYQIKDLAGVESAPATVTITLNGVNDAPVAVNDVVPVRPSGPTTFNPLVNDTDAEGNDTIVPSTLIVTLQPSFGSLTINSATGTMTYTPGPDFTGTDLIRYRVRDNYGVLSNQASIFINVNDAPLAQNDSVVTYRNESITFAPLDNDQDPNGTLDPSTLEIVTGPTNGQIIINPDGTMTYQPNTDFFGSDRLTYRVADNSGLQSNTAEVSIRVVASRLQNPDNRLDVNASGEVSPIDALLVINLLNRSGSSSLAIDPYLPGPPFYDVNGDLRITPLDALQVINALNQLASGEGESTVVTPTPMIAPATLSGIGTQWIGTGTATSSELVDDICLPNRPAIASPANVWDADVMDLSSDDETLALVAVGQPSLDTENDALAGAVDKLFDDLDDDDLAFLE